jgi:hypothetical protein
MNKKLLAKLNALSDIHSLVSGYELNNSSCILMSRIGVEYLKSVNVKSELLTVRVQSTSKKKNGDKFVLVIGGRNDIDSEKATELNLIQPSGSGIGFNGHLVVLIENKYILDLTSFQMERKERGLIPPSILLLELQNLGLQGPIDLGSKELKPHHYKLRQIQKYFYNVDDGINMIEYFEEENQSSSKYKNSTAFTQNVKNVVKDLKKIYKNEKSNSD